MTGERRRRRGLAREIAGEAWGLAVEVLVTGAAILVALGLAALILLVA
jgi:hypothetical protein